MEPTPNLSIILPCLNEGDSLADLLRILRKLYPHAEIIVVDDGSTPEIVADSSIRVIRHPYRIGNGAAIKTGVRNAHGDILVMMDADGQHDPQDIPRFLDELSQGHDMVVGAREVSTHASIGRRIANKLYNLLASSLTGFIIKDLTSGFRAVHAKPFRN
ncbi:MAG: glycosyltransferase family 2 protein, partial [Gammaproteobacteria bacterium]|nr:glycosyltransferase family 2 protein [Gammaproteobacteria bacterium]